jgi:hypothetical protein
VRPILANVALALALVAAAGAVRSAPIPSPRALPPTTLRPDGALAVRESPADALGGACGTRLEALGELLEARAAAAPVTLQPTPNSVDAGGIAVLEDDGTFFYLDKGGHPVLDVSAVTRAFYRTHDDDVTFLAVYLASGLNQWLGSPTALAAAWGIRNDIDGLGLARFEDGAAFGSPSRLETVLTMNGLHRYLADPDEVWPGDTFSAMRVLAHEFGHRWLAYAYVDSAGTAVPALLGRDREHWNFFFDADSSFMEGCDWTAVGADSFVTTGATTTWGALDQYLMGLRSKAEMDSFFVVNGPTGMNPPGIYVPWSIPGVGIGCLGNATWWKVDDIERVHGPRAPDAASAPHAWRIAFALVVPQGQAAGAADLAKLGAIRARFPQLVTGATGGRGSVDVTLPSRPGHLAIAHEPLADREDGATARLFSARVLREGGAAALVSAAPEVRLHWRAGTSGPFEELALPAAAADSFAATLPPPAGTLQYWISAELPADGLSAQWPAAGAAAPLTFVTGPDTQPPSVAHVPIPAQAATRLPQVMLARVSDNLGLDSVWCETAVDGGPVVTVPVAHAGGDSFTVALGAGLFAGHRVAYRFLARDASAAGNLGMSNPAFDTLRVVRNVADDFENPSGYAHQPVIWSYRDPWVTDTFRSVPAGGTSWHFGETGGVPYPPHSDATLFLPWIYGLEPGATLRFDEWHDLEDAGDGLAFDAFRAEVMPWGGTAAVPVEPSPGYTHAMLGRSLSIPRNAACWSGDSQGWVTRAIDLSQWAPGPARVQLHACADDWIGRGGVWIDRVRVLFPNGGSLGVPAPVEIACGPAWPNPTRGELRLPLALPRAATVEWSLHDVQGRRVATLWRGRTEAGRLELFAAAPRALAPGLYFSRVRVDGRERASQRVTLVR